MNEKKKNKFYNYGMAISEKDYTKGKKMLSGRMLTAEVSVGYHGADGTIQHREMTMDEFVALFGFERRKSEE
jgi:hypothetical protein